jgi:uncharacterized membrane protein
MEMFIFFAGLIIVLIVSSGFAVSILFLGDMNPDSRQNRRVNYTLSDLKDNEKLKKLIAEVKDYKEKVPS